MNERIKINLPVNNAESQSLIGEAYLIRGQEGTYIEIDGDEWIILEFENVEQGLRLELLDVKTEQRRKTIYF